jgi:class 3 adenylate cyclase
VTCPTCHYRNDAEARFCVQCGHALDIFCHACGSRVKAGVRFCGQCGQRLTQPVDVSQAAVDIVASSTHPPSLDEKLAQLQGYLPSHLADKILANRGRLEGERKLVTVLFADITGYTSLSEQLGEEALFTLMDDLYELFIHEVHRYEGTVNELTGDGIIAFFGAPLAVEQAPQRAVRAALALQDAVAQFSARLERERGTRLQVRVGINTGPVVVGTVGNNLRMDYKAVGNTVNLAARMEQTAAPGTVQITAQTHRLVAGYFDCDDLGPVGVKGVTAKVRAYRVTGERRA